MSLPNGHRLYTDPMRNSDKMTNKMTHSSLKADWFDNGYAQTLTQKLKMDFWCSEWTSDWIWLPLPAHAFHHYWGNLPPRSVTNICHQHPYSKLKTEASLMLDNLVASKLVRVRNRFKWFFSSTISAIQI